MRSTTTYQDSAGFDKQAPVNDITLYADSTTGRPWSQCGQWTTGSWWGVDLGSVVNLKYIRLQNRNDCCPDRLSDFEVHLGLTPPTGTTLPTTGTTVVSSGVTVQSNVMLQLNINAAGRYLYLNRASGGAITNDPICGQCYGLTVCKLYVYT